MARRGTTYRSLASLQRDNRACRACLEAGFPIVPPPVFEGRAGQRAILVGQSPGEREGGEGRPWRGRAGQTLRRWLDMDEEAFYGAFYCCSVTRCYPGKSPGGRGDRVPMPRELDLCRLWLDHELALLRPALVVTVGGLAARRVLGLNRLTDHVGSKLALGAAVAVPLPHPSGASGWLNLAANRALVERAIAHVHVELESLGAARSYQHR